MKNGRKALSMFLCGVLLIVSCLLNGCAASDSSQETQALQENEYYVYYRTGDAYTLSAKVCRVESSERQELIRGLYEKLQEPADSSLASAVPKDLLLASIYIDGTNLLLNFSANYTAMRSTEEILCRTAIVKTMLQIDGIDGVSFNVADQQLVSNSGRTIGVMTADSFEDSINQSLKETELTLYFADETGMALKAEQREIVYSSGQALERLVVEALIDGPASENCYPVLESNLQLTGISVSDSICYVYFDVDFLQNTLEVADYIPIFAIVNSLSELPNISRVQFVIGGSQDVTFRESISLSGALSRNLNYIIQE